MPDHDAPSSPAERYLQLIALAVHELRTPLSVVSGYLRMLEQDQTAPLPDRQRTLVEQAEHSCQRLTALISELSDIGRFDSGEIAPARDLFDLVGLLQAVGARTREAADRGVRLEIRAEASRAPVTGDRWRLGEALDALFRSVLREQPSAGVVVALCRIPEEPSGSVTVVIANASVIDRVNTAARLPFDEHRGGLGLALPLARRVIEAHGGCLWTPESGTGVRIPSAGFALPLAN